jgi:acetyltransferase-like isoleucine patch superfamily enzyme
MRAYVLSRPEPVAPWNEPADALEVFARPIGEWRRKVLTDAGFEVIEVRDPADLTAGGPALIVGADVVFGSQALRAFTDDARSEARDRVLALPDCAFVRFTSPFMKLRTAEVEGRTAHLYDVFWSRDGRFDPADLERFVPLLLDPAERVLPTSAPPFAIGERIPMGVTPRYVFHVRHWIHVLLANIVGGLCEALARAREPRWWAWLTWRLVRAFPWTPRRVLGTFVHRGRRCFIHPTATVEGCVLGDGVIVDAGAVVRGSILADGARVGQHARVQWSVIGRGARISWNGIASFAVLMRGSESSFPGVQMSVLGREAYFASGAWQFDTSFTGPVPVRVEGRVVQSHHLLLGIAVGHQAFLGAGVRIAAGREVPNRTRWIENPSGLATKIPPDLAPDGVYAVHDGAPVSLDQLAAGKRRS